VLALRATFHEDEAAGVTEAYEFRVDDEVFHARVQDGQPEAVHGPAWQPTLTVTSDRDTFRELAAGALSLQDAARSGRVTIDVNPRAIRRFERIFSSTRARAAGLATATRSTQLDPKRSEDSQSRGFH
jgi:hypothetical protein